MGLDQKVFAQRLRARRLELNLTQARLGELVGLKKAAVTNMERPLTKPSIDIFCEMAAVLGVSLDYLAGLDSRPQPPKWITEMMENFEFLDRSGQEAVKALVKGLKKT
jgi:transcriptional regulator with XRE-family HTH domain